MIGNDIVDLQLAKVQSNWRRSGFIKKIYTLEEQSFINQSVNPEFEVWKLWSRKEAAYKIYNRETGVRSFFPWKIKCSIESTVEGISTGFVLINDRKYYTKTELNNDFIYTVAVSSSDLFDKIVEVQKKEHLVKINDLPYCRFSLKPASITHHGRYERQIVLVDS